MKTIKALFFLSPFLILSAVQAATHLEADVPGGRIACEVVVTQQETGLFGLAGKWLALNINYSVVADPAARAVFSCNYVPRKNNNCGKGGCRTEHSWTCRTASINKGQSAEITREDLFASWFELAPGTSNAHREVCQKFIGYLKVKQQ